MLESHDGPLIIKPSIGSGSGFYIHRIEVRGRQIFDDNPPLWFDFIEKGFGGKTYLFQEVISQYPSVAVYLPKSVNTCRAITIWLDDAFNVVAGTFRMGCGKDVDKGHAGGLLCGISDDGSLPHSHLAASSGEMTPSQTQNTRLRNRPYLNMPR